MTSKDLANVIFPNITKTIKDYENEYPKRKLKDNEEVTRFAPSPTGFMHIGNFMSALIDFIIAKNSNGIFYLRNEDTDKKREVDTAVELIMNTLNHYGLSPDEYEYKGEIIGKYGPYVQSERKEIYHTFIKYLIEIGRAYPCFCTSEVLEDMRKNQERFKMRTGYYGRYATCRNISVDEAIERINNGEKYVIRFKSEGNFDKHFPFNDLCRGRIDLPENDQDIVIMKSDNLLPTYHFAHLVDDYLMGTTCVVRGEEWLPSTPVHIELFETFGFTPPKYIHTPWIMKKDGDTVRKISKRKDPEALMKYYDELGYPTEAVIEAVMTIVNSNYEEWHTNNPDKTFLEFPFSPKKMSNSGAFFDLDKLDNISKNIISKYKASYLYDELLKWTNTYDKEFNDLLSKHKDYSINILNIEREQKKPRKDYANYSSIKKNIWYMYDELFIPKETDYEFMKITDKEEIKNILSTYLEKYYSSNDDKDEWFNKIKLLSSELGYASNMKDYKTNPDNYKGSVADISTVLRVALTTKSNTPDLYELMNLIGIERMKERFNKFM
jgi:glutamyl-tRNA synthetase